jgi:hypothetical protein
VYICKKRIVCLHRWFVCSKLVFTIRETRLGEFSPIGRLFTYFGQVFAYISSANFWATWANLGNKRKIVMYWFRKNVGGALFWVTFLQTHLVTRYNEDLTYVPVCYFPKYISAYITMYTFLSNGVLKWRCSHSLIFYMNYKINSVNFNHKITHRVSQDFEKIDHLSDLVSHTRAEWGPRFNNTCRKVPCWQDIKYWFSILLP